MIRGQNSIKEKKKYRKGSDTENSLGYGIELSASLRSVVPIAYSSSAYQCCLQKPGSKKKWGYWYYSFQISYSGIFSAFQSFGSIGWGA